MASPDNDLLLSWVAATKPVVLGAISSNLLPHLRHMMDDVAQETWLRAWRSKKRFDEVSALSAWLYTIARNEARRANVRDFRERRRAKRLGEDLRGDGLSPQTETPVDIRPLLQGLPDPHRAILLAVVQGLDEKALASKFAVPRGTVKSRLSRAREAWARHLRELETNVIHPIPTSAPEAAL